MKKEIELVNELIDKLNKINSDTSNIFVENLMSTLKELDQDSYDLEQVKKALDSLEKGFAITNDKTDGITYYKIGTKYHQVANTTKTKETVDLNHIKKHLRSEALEVHRYFFRTKT